MPAPEDSIPTAWPEPRTTPSEALGDAALAGALRMTPPLDEARVRSAVRELFGTELAWRLGEPRRAKHTGGHTAHVVAVVAHLDEDGQETRAALQLEAAFAHALLRITLGAAPEATGPAVAVPPTDGERGVLLYLAARLLESASGWRVLAVVSTPDALAEALGADRTGGDPQGQGARIHTPLFLELGALRTTAEWIVTEEAAARSAPRTWVSLGVSTLTREEFAALDEGDLMLLDDGPRAGDGDAPSEVWLRQAGTPVRWAGTWQADRVTLVRAETSTGAAPGAADGSVVLDVSLGALPAHVRFASLAAGTEVVLGRPAARTATLLEDGRPAAEGTLVAHEGAWAVHITRGPHRPSAAASGEPPTAPGAGPGDLTR